MKKTVLISIVIIFGLFLSACEQRNAAGQPTEDIVGDVNVQQDEVAVEELNVEEQDTVDGSEESQLQEENVAVEEVALDTCIECHTDQQVLTDTAKPEDAHESESEGEG